MINLTITDEDLEDKSERAQLEMLMALSDKLKRLNRAIRKLRNKPSISQEKLGVSPDEMMYLKSIIDKKDECNPDILMVPGPPYMLSDLRKRINTTSMFAKHFEQSRTREDIYLHYDDFSICRHNKKLRYKVIFKKEPIPAIIHKLKSLNFWWSPNNECWECHISVLGRYKIDNFIDWYKSRKDLLVS